MKKYMITLLIVLSYSACQHKSIDNNQNKNFDHLAGIDSINKVSIFISLAADDYDSIISLQINDTLFYQGKFIHKYRSHFENDMLIAYIIRTEGNSKFHVSIGNSDTTFNYLMTDIDSIMVIGWYKNKFHASDERGRKFWKVE